MIPRALARREVFGGRSDAPPSSSLTIANRYYSGLVHSDVAVLASSDLLAAPDSSTGNVSSSPWCPVSVAFSELARTGKLVATGYESGKLRLDDVGQVTVSVPPSSYTCSPRCSKRVRLSSFDSVGSSGSSGSSGDRRRWAETTPHSGMINRVAWARGDTRLFAASSDTTVSLNDVETLRVVSAFGRDRWGHTWGVKDIALLDKDRGDVLVSCSRDGSIIAWDARAANHKPVWKRELAQGAPARSLSSSNAIATRSVTSVEFLPIDRLIASAGSGSTEIKLWDVRGMSGMSDMSSSSSPVRVLSFLGREEHDEHRRRGITKSAGIISLAACESKGGKLLISASNGFYRIFDTKRFELRGTYLSPCRNFYNNSEAWFVDACFNIDGSRFLASGTDGKAYVWNCEEEGVAACLSGLCRRPPPMPLPSPCLTLCNTTSTATTGCQGGLNGVSWSPGYPDLLATAGHSDAYSVVWKLWP